MAEKPPTRLPKYTKVPRRYLNKVLQELVQAGLVKSQSGPGGGYTLAVAPEKVTILAVVNAVSPVERIRHCPLGLPSHTRLCPLHKELDRVYAEMEKAFGRVTVAELLRSTSKSCPCATFRVEAVAASAKSKGTTSREK